MVGACAESTAGLLPNGHVLTSADTYGEGAPTKFFEFDGRKLIPQPDIPDSPIDGGVEFLVLPSGQILEFDSNTDVEIYKPAVDRERPWYAPSRLEAPLLVSPGKSYNLRGVHLNGVSQGAMEGDNYQMATNYPLVHSSRVTTGWGTLFMVASAVMLVSSSVGAVGGHAAAGVRAGQGSAQAGRRMSASSQRRMCGKSSSGISDSRQSVAIEASWKSAIVSRSQAE